MGLLDDVLGAVTGSTGDWRDRLQPAAYVSPKGDRIAFDYSATPSDVATLSSVNVFPGVQGAFVQSFGTGASTFPITAVFHGANADLGRAALVEALSQPGVGKLEHPTRGTFDVVVTGAIGIRDDVVDSANVYTVETELTATLRGAWPLAEASLGSELVSAFDAYNAAQAALFASQLDTGLVSDLQRFRGDYRATLRTIRGSLATVAAAQDASRANFETLFSDVLLGIDTLITQPANLMFKQQMLMALPGSMLRRLRGQAAASFALALSVLSGIFDFTGAASRLRAPSDATRHATSDRNAFAANDHAVASGLIAASLGALDVAFQSRDEATSTAVAILATLDAARAWRDEEVSAMGGEINPLWPDVVAIVERAAGSLVTKSFSLRQRRKLRLDRDRTALDLISELYGGLDRLDEFASTNNLSAEEQVIIRRGRVVEWLA